MIIIITIVYRIEWNDPYEASPKNGSKYNIIYKRGWNPNLNR